MSKKAIILGCGNSAGVPAIGNNWGKCDPKEPKNRRSRCCLAITDGDKNIIIDTGPEFKVQFNGSGLSCPDAVFYTHAHADHIAGIDELRWLSELNSRVLPVYGSRETMDEIVQRFNFLFKPARPDLYAQYLQAHFWEESDFYKQHEVVGFKFTLVPLDHETVTASGFRFGDFAYTTDMARMVPEALEALKGVKTWVVDSAAYKSTNDRVHCTFEKILEYNKVIQAEQVYLTAMGKSMDYKTIFNETPDGYAPAYDGLEIEIS
jgi:phosphoribosyl 1,2-cyclic phosphate phosphodiesterase